VDWAVGPQAARRIAEVVTSWARWGGAAPPNANSWNWIWQWSQRKSSMGFEILLLLSLISVVAQCTRLKTDHAFRSVSLLAGAGIIYVFAMAPELRFGIGYLCLPPALCLSSGCPATTASAKVEWLKPIGLAAWSLSFLVALFVSAERHGYAEGYDGVVAR